LIPPDEFIPLAEQAGTIGVLGERVLDTAVADLARLAAIRPHHRLAIGVNVSPRQLTDPTFVEHVLGLIRLHGLTPDQLVLEVTEQAFEADLTSVAATVDALATAGVSVAVDDFGTGYSSLRYLQHLRLEVMKIDRSFVAEIPSVRGSQLVSSIATMGTALGLQLVAEGIENLDQLRVLQSFNCELGQGYLFSPPVPIEEFEQLITTGHVYPLGDGDAAPLVPTPRPAAA
jgi:EAL domain-containing protein (putative c-di-GMP-specific phosphodiesterase class I)